MRLITCLAVATALTLPAFAQQIDHHRIENLADGPASAVELERAGYSVVEGGITSTSVEVHTTPVEVAALQNQGYQVELISLGRPLQEIMPQLIDSSGIDGVPAGYPTVADGIAQLFATEANFPAIAMVVNVTQTYGVPQTHDGNDVYAIKISDNVGVEEDEPSMFVMSQIHANEIGTSVATLYAIDELTQNYATDPQIKAVVDNNEIFIGPMWNPDGIDHVHFVSANWRKNRRNNGGNFGVDLNRNYDSGWTAPCSGSTNTSSGNYKGPAPFSEPENQACKALSEDQEFAKMIEYHSSGRETLWEFNCTTHPWANLMLQSAQLLSNASGYGTANRPPSAEGEHYEWQFLRGAWSHLIEISNSQQPSYASAQSEAIQLFPGFIWMLEQSYWFSGHVTDACSGAPVEASIDFIGVTIPFGGSFKSTSDFGRYDLMPQTGPYTVEFSAPGYATQSFAVDITGSSPTVLDVALIPTSSVAEAYCTAGSSASGCQATLSAVGTASATAVSGFTVSAANVEGKANGQYYYGTNGRQANPWGTSSSFRCVVPPTTRAGIGGSGGTNGACDGAFAQDLNALWSSNPAKNPGAGATVQLQYWYRDPQNTSNQTTSFSDALEFGVCP